jgi:tetratricopeptide (TPR) repeat protein
MGGEPRPPDQPAVGSVAWSQGVQAGRGNVQHNYYYDGVRRAEPERPLVVGSVPQAPPAFQPRGDLLAALRAAGPGVSVVRSVTGIRGVGKTQVAAAYARECIDAGWRLVAWVNAEDTAEALAGLALVAAQLGIPQDGSSVADLGKLVRARLEADGERCLLVFDNVTGIKALRDYIPAAGQARVVITTTSSAAAGRIVPVDVFTEDEALAFLAERTGRAGPGAAELARELGYLPLALAQAAAVITGQHLAYAVYLDRLRQFPLADYLSPADSDPYPRGVAEAILLSADAVTAADPTGLCDAMLALTALLSPAGVSRDLLHIAGSAGALPGPAQAAQPSPAEIDAGLGRLAGASLLTFNEDGTTVTAHRLVTRVLRERHAHDRARPDLAAMACTALWAVGGSLGEPWRNRPAARGFVAHVIAVHDHVAPALRDDDPATRDLLLLRSWALRYLVDLADSAARAVEVGLPLLTDLERVLGADYPDTLVCRGNLALAYQAAGQFDAAIRLHEQILADSERVLGATHLETLTSRNNLALAYRAAGRLAEAIPLFERTSLDRERALGPDHPDTLTSRNNLAFAYRDAGRLDAAIPALEQTLIDRERVLGPDHPETLASRGNLALAYQDVGQPERASALHEQVLITLDRAFGPDHPKTLASRDNLAGAYHDAGQLERAIPLHEQALAGRERVLGPGHPDTLTSRNNLALAYRAAGRLAEAISLYEQALAGLERVLGPEHPTTNVVRANLAVARREARKAGDQDSPAG